MQRTDEKKDSILTEPTGSFRSLIDQLPSLSEKKQRQIYEESKSHLLECYLQAVEEVKKGKNLPTEEKLKRLLVPLIGYSKLDPFGESIPFVDESVDIRRELDLENLVYDRERYDFGLTDKGHGLNEYPLLSPSSHIFITEKFESDLKIQKSFVETIGADPIFFLGERSLKEVYEKWLPSLDQERIGSPDLLDQVLVAYTIKKAQNGDKEAVQKLHDLYVSAAQGQAVKVLKSEARRIGYPIQKTDLADIKEDAKFLLEIIIRGFRPDDIMQRLLEGEETMKGIPPWVKHFYIFYLGEYLPQRMGKNIRETQRNQTLITDLGRPPGDAGRNQAKVIALLKARDRFLDFLRIGTLNPYAPIQARTRWKTPKRFNRFNSYSFQLGVVKMGPIYNLTTWLFGHKHRIAGYSPTGKLYQLLRDKWRPLLKEKSKSQNFDFKDDFVESDEENIFFKDREKSIKVDATQDKDLIHKETKEKVITILSKSLSDRNVEICRQWLFEGLTQAEIGDRYDLSTRQIKRIYQKAKALIPRNFLE